MKTVTIEIPDDCEVKIVKKEEKKKPIIRTYQDLIDSNIDIKGCWINAMGKIEYLPLRVATSSSKNVVASEKVAKSMLAMAMISQLMPYYGGMITDEEWGNESIRKYCFIRTENRMDAYQAYWTYHFLAFHTPEQRAEFLKYNEQLVKDYLML